MDNYDRARFVATALSPLIGAGFEIVAREAIGKPVDPDVLDRFLRQADEGRRVLRQCIAVDKRLDDAAEFLREALHEYQGVTS